MHSTHRAAILLLGWLATLPVMAEEEDRLALRDIESQHPKKLGKDEVTAMLTGARVSRVSGRGNVHSWRNEADGSFVVSTDNRGAGAARASGRPTTAQGKWHISDDGRYCILIEWRSAPTEEWCRYVLQADDGFYAVRAESPATERVHRLDITK
ncbi:conserved exported hypothetical protein [Burkholderiales bacterium 8X]|nr:conserved exported hypothetical protein [Burkholderiales bacterium 8X]